MLGISEVPWIAADSTRWGRGESWNVYVGTDCLYKITRVFADVYNLNSADFPYDCVARLQARTQSGAKAEVLSALLSETFAEPLVEPDETL